VSEKRKQERVNLMVPDTSSTSSQRSQRYGLTAWSRT
jgi:hypothetical protein